MEEKRTRKNELDCLNKIKESFLFSNTLKKEFDNSDYFIMSAILSSAHQNENSNDFPDFFFDGGIIEHFEVTTADEDRKGSKYIRDSANYQRLNEEEIKKQDNEFINSPHQPHSFQTITIENQHNGFSYENFVKSFKKNAEQHLCSLSKSKCVNQTIVFLIEKQGGSLFYPLNSYQVRFYRISEDKQLLQYIKEEMSSVDYIIYRDLDRYEIIDLSKIDSLIAVAKDCSNVKCGPMNNTYIKLYIDW